MNTILILVLGAGELGMPVLRNLVRCMEFARTVASPREIDSGELEC